MWRSGKRGTLIDWLCVAGVAAVFSLLLYRGLTKTWSEAGIPPAVQGYLRWEKQHMPRWFVQLF